MSSTVLRGLPRDLPLSLALTIPALMLALAICDSRSEKTVAIIKDVATAYYKDNLDICHDEPSILAINGFKDSSMTVTIHQKAKGFKHYQIQRDLRMLIKERFDEEGIQIPYSQIVVHNAD